METPECNNGHVEKEEQSIEIDKTAGNALENFALVNEGAASVLFPKDKNVFYNPVQEFNRDLTIAVISTFIRMWIKEEQQEEQTEHLGKHRRRKIKVLKRGDDVKWKASKEHPRNISSDVEILEGLAASGLRSVRFALEIPKFVPTGALRRVLANDLDANAYELMKRNIVRNGITDVMSASCDDVIMLMLNRVHDARKVLQRVRMAKAAEAAAAAMKHESDCNANDSRIEEDVSSAEDEVEGERLFQVIDLDPYGTAAPFLDSSVQALEDGGLLCVTCTDTAVLCGQTPETCFTKYGSVSLRAKFCHEQALRILLHSLSSHASRHSKYIEPLLSLSIDFYVRVFVRIHTGQAQAKMAFTKSAMAFNCSGCGTHHLQPMGTVEKNGNSTRYMSPSVAAGLSEKCGHCGHRMHIGGPMWSEPIHNLDFVARVKALATSPDTPQLKTEARILGMLTLVEEELQDIPLYYVLDEGICGALHCFTPPSIKFRSAFLNAGYRISLSHAAESSVKTNAPAEFVWDVMRTWIKESAMNPQRMVEGSVPFNILSVEPKNTIDFTPHPEATAPSQMQGLQRFPANPESHWGPKPRAKNREYDTGEPTTKKKKKAKHNGDESKDLKQYKCKRLIAGNCDLADKCIYSHDVEILEEAAKEQSCMD